MARRRRSTSWTRTIVCCSRRPYGSCTPQTQAFVRHHSCCQRLSLQVILALTELYYYLAPYAEMSLVVRPLMHTLTHSREVQLIILTSINSMINKRASLFEPYMKEFFVRGSVRRASQHLHFA